MTYDVFVSYRHSRKAEVMAFCELLEQANISYFRDEERRQDDASIQIGIENGLARSKLLLAWFDPTYLESRACAWELGRAILAARQQGANFRLALERIVCIDPTSTFSHILPEELWDRARRLDLQHPQACIGHLLEQLAKCDEPLGQVASTLTDNWYERECPTHFTWVGRDAELIWLFSQLCRGEVAMKADDRAPVAIVGHGGEGKTMLAEQYAIRHAAAYPGGIVWLNGLTADLPAAPDAWLRRLELELENIAGGKLGLSTKASLDGVTDLRRRVKVLKGLVEARLKDDEGFTAVGRGPYLWVVDDLPPLPTDDMRLWTPNGNHVHCIVTMREGVSQAVFRKVELKKLSDKLALKILTRERPPENDQEVQAALSIVEQLGRLPLALELAASAVDTYCDFLEILKLPLNVGLEPLLAEMSSALPTVHAQSIVKTFDRSLALVPGAEEISTYSANESTWTLLRATALLSPAPLPDDFAVRIHRAMGFPEHLFQTIVIPRAKAKALVQRPGPSARPCSQMHALLARTVVETRINDAQSARMFWAIVQATREWFEEEARKPPVDVDRRILSVAAPLLRQNDSLEAADVMQSLGALAYEIGRPRDAVQLHARCLDIRRQRLGLRNEVTVGSMQALALARLAEGSAEEAKSLLEDVVTLRLALGSSSDPETLDAIDHLATTLVHLGEFSAARERQEWVLTCRRRLDALAPETLGCASNLAITLQIMNDLERARALHSEVFSARRALFGDESPDTVDSMQHLGVLAQIDGDLDSAEALQRKVWAFWHRRGGRCSPEALSAMHNLAVTRRLRGKHRSASVLLKRTVELQRMTMGESHPATLGATQEWAEALLAEGETGRALQLLESQVDNRRRELGSDHNNTRSSMAALARAHFAQGNLDRARALQESLLQSQLDDSDLSDPSVLLEPLVRLLATVQAQGDLPRAMELQRLLDAHRNASA